MYDAAIRNSTSWHGIVRPMSILKLCKYSDGGGSKWTLLWRGTAISLEGEYVGTGIMGMTYKKMQEILGVRPCPHPRRGSHGLMNYAFL